jgi:hypothetical protein
MERPLSDFFRMHWDLEPVRIPLNRPPGTLSPTGGEGRDEGVRFTERARRAQHYACIGNVFLLCEYCLSELGSSP